MKVSIKRKVLESVIEKIAEARSSHSVNINSLAKDPTPVAVSSYSAVQLGRPARYKDPSFVPVTPQELGDELKAMASTDINPNKVKKVYKLFKRMIGEEQAVNEAKDLIAKLVEQEITQE